MATGGTLKSEAPRRRTNVPHLDLRNTVTRYRNDYSHPGDIENGQLNSPFKFKDEKSGESELRTPFSSRMRRERFFSGVLVASNDFISPRSGCLTPLSSARPLKSSNYGHISNESRECASMPNSSRDSSRRKDRSQESALPDSLRSRFSKNAIEEESGTDTGESNFLSESHITQRGPLEQKLYEQGIMPVYEPKCCKSSARCNTMPIVPDISDLRVFLACPGPKNGGHVQCHIKRIVGSYKMYPRYKLYLTNGDIFLLSARKRKKSKTSNYIMSLDQDDISRTSGNYFGNIQSNFIGTKFWFYDKGDVPSINKDNIHFRRPSDRVELGAVMYDKNLFGAKGPRKMTAIIPAIDSDDRSFVFDQESTNSPNILSRYSSDFDHDKMVIMRSKMPHWNKEMKAYCLNFNGRATYASVKNFQLVTDQNNDNIILQLGKAGKNYFTMDYQYPMSALQAFSICVSSLDRKFG